jgi:hypothetical protein
LRLPFYCDLTEEQIQTVLEKITEFYEGLSLRYSQNRPTGEIWDKSVHPSR